MDSPLVQRFRNDTAPRLLAKFSNGGVSAQVRVVTPNPDPLLPPDVDDVSVEFSAYVKGVTDEMIASDPNLIVSDLAVICAAIDYQPEVDAMIEVNGEAMRVLRVSPIPASGDPAAYWFWVR